MRVRSRTQGVIAEMTTSNRAELSRKRRDVRGSHRAGVWTLLLGTVLTSALTSSCVSQQEYDDAKDLATQYQREWHGEQTKVATLTEELERLRSELRAGKVVSLKDAGHDKSFAQRMNELQSRIDGLGRPMKDIERFDVDGGYVLMIQDKVLFASGSAEVGSDGRGALLDLAADIQASTHGRIVVRGHTDSDPVTKESTMRRFPHGNLQLSAERAISVASILIKDGKVRAQDVVVTGFGPWQPVAANDSSESKRLNRRVEIFVADA